MLAPRSPSRGGDAAGNSRSAEDDALGVPGARDPLPLLPRLIGGFRRASGPRHPPVVTAGGCPAQVVAKLGVPAEQALRPLLIDVRIVFERRTNARSQAIECQLGPLTRPNAGSPAGNQ